MRQICSITEAVKKRENTGQEVDMNGLVSISARLPSRKEVLQ